MRVNSSAEYRAILRACRSLSQPTGNYHDNDYVSNLVETVLDYRLRVEIVNNAYSHFEKHLWDRLRTHGQLVRFLARFPNTTQGNRAGAVTLWGYRYGRRFRQLRYLVSYIKKVGVTNQQGLRRWARNSSFEQDFAGRIKGLGFAVYKWLQIRLGVPTIKPDVHVKNFLKRVTRRVFTDEEAVAVLERAAKTIRWKAYELDWAIWEAEKARQGTG